MLSVEVLILVLVLMFGSVRVDRVVVDCFGGGVCGVGDSAGVGVWIVDVDVGLVLRCCWYSC